MNPITSRRVFVKQAAAVFTVAALPYSLLSRTQTVFAVNPVAQEHVVIIIDFKFATKMLLVKVGDTVVSARKFFLPP